MGHDIKILYVFFRLSLRPTRLACLKLLDVTILIRMTKCPEYVTKFPLTSPNILVPI
jgi:hypothetical protein